ncbi:MAG TPA: toxin [Planctomycetes bacterium]|jgi:adenylate kinase family enzyme|nr:toxin [Planctomycetota bacterium]
MQATPEPVTSSARLSRVWVVGSCGAGKTTTARRIAEILETQSVHIDEFLWLPKWKLREREEMLAMVEDRLAGEAWVMEGNLRRDARRLWQIVDRAELVVWLDLPFRLTWLRIARRSLTRSLLRRSCCNGNYETLRRAFFSRKSMLLYAFKTRRLRALIYSRLLASRRHIRLRTPAEVAGFIEALSLAGSGVLAHPNEEPRHQG